MGGGGGGGGGGGEGDHPHHPPLDPTLHIISKPSTENNPMINLPIDKHTWFLF